MAYRERKLIDVLGLQLWIQLSTRLSMLQLGFAVAFGKTRYLTIFASVVVVFYHLLGTGMVCFRRSQDDGEGREYHV